MINYKDMSNNYIQYKGIIAGFPEINQKSFYIDVVLLKPESDAPTKPIVDEELEDLLKNISDPCLLVSTGVFEEDFEEYVNDIEQDLAEEKLTPFFYLRIYRTLAMDENGLFITKDGNKIDKILSDEETEIHISEISKELRSLLTYIDKNYLKYPTQIAK